MADILNANSLKIKLKNSFIKQKPIIIYNFIFKFGSIYPFTKNVIAKKMP